MSHDPINYPVPYQTVLDNAVVAGYDEEQLALFRIYDNWTDFSNGPYAPYLSYIIARDMIQSRFNEAEHIIMTDPPTAVYYAKEILQARWNDAEYWIGQDPHAACDYAIDVIEARWQAVEDLIFTVPIAAANYVSHIIGHKHVPAEAGIQGHPNAIYKYSNRVLNGRWPQGETPFLGFEHPMLCYLYAKDCVKGRWVAAEMIMQKNPIAWQKYQENVLKERVAIAKDIG
jgi:hypothetical protein